MLPTYTQLKLTLIREIRKCMNKASRYYLPYNTFNSNIFLDLLLQYNTMQYNTIPKHTVIRKIVQWQIKTCFYC